MDDSPVRKADAAAGAPTDLAGREHWDAFYQLHAGATGLWEPRTYDYQVLARALGEELLRTSPQSVLEIGCGDSPWLGWLARTYGIRVAGLDYSPRGCEQARARLAAEGVTAEVHCADLWQASADSIGTYDFVFSLGVVEHFTDLPAVLRQMSCLLRPGGTLFCEVPNLRSLHGWMSRLWQPGVLAKHRPVDLRELKNALQAAGLENIRGRTVGLFSLGVVAWELEPRWPRLAKVLLRPIQYARQAVDLCMRGLRAQRGPAWLAPFLYAAGTRTKSSTS